VQQPYSAVNKLKWNPNSFLPQILNEVKPDLDRSLTPISLKKQVCLDRIFDKDIWVPNKFSMSFLQSPET